VNVYTNLPHPPGKMFYTLVLDLGVTRDFCYFLVLQCNMANCPLQNKLRNQQLNYQRRQMKDYYARIWKSISIYNYLPKIFLVMFMVHVSVKRFYLSLKR